MKKIYCLALSIVALFIFMTGVPVKGSEMDDRIESSAKKSYVFETILKNDEININSNNGVVTLTGTVAEEYFKSLAQYAIEEIPEVKSVDNRLNLKGFLPGDDSDGWTISKVKTAIMFHRDVNANITDVSSKEGIVTLIGEAYSQAQKELITEYVKNIESVIDVNNQMTVTMYPPKQSEKMSRPIDDPSITAQLKVVLMLLYTTHMFNNRVETNNGEVTLYGKVISKDENYLVTKIVSNIHGVKNVINKMSLE